MYYGFRLVALLCLLLSAIYSQPGWAESCGGRVGQMTINVPNIRYLPTLRADTQMTNAMADSGGGIHFVCDLQLPGASWKRIVYRQINTAGSPRIINGQHVYASALSGMGYSLGFQCGGGPVHYIDGSNAPAGSESVTVCESSQLSTLLAQREVVVKAYITFYKTGDVALVSGNHASVPGLPQVGNLYIEEQDSSRTSRTASAPVSIDLAALNVDIGASGSCQVARPTINVNLGTVNKAEFKGKSTAAGVAQTFSIPVSCTTPTDIRIGFFGVTADPGVSDTLALEKVDGAASGVGIELSYGNNPAPAPSAGTPVKINESSNLPVLKHIAGGNAAAAESINFTARYVQTGDVVTPGRANGLATFALEYN
ncbi:MULTISPECIES: fimbrial protein [Raoultella]|jgi:type 1 fimbria pilin|uniref:fimbrial protein n=1 Tax=Raoultella TaxID=160674 RepID=UPI0008F5DED3|nr:fimbrial protein [Raoultella ornithinolytica]APB07258.1 fimbrial protein [Raoultella ornithinolytica]MCC2038130.1 fimbrial protein [Raoultella ornithinolytica]MCC2043713.1 fimbrial protein [Raoultella ornithinolytica]MCC2048552.1 fimbrial protein [Raoultella ornithinolytica]MCC2054184.1 fimbrial protein [Raoultella ornithinolytica]